MVYTFDILNLTIRSMSNHISKIHWNFRRVFSSNIFLCTTGVHDQFLETKNSVEILNISLKLLKLGLYATIGVEI